MAWPKWLLREIAQVACIVRAQLLADDCRSFYVNPCFYLAALSPNLYGSTFALCMLIINYVQFAHQFPLQPLRPESHNAPWCHVPSFPRIEPIKLQLSFSYECSQEKCPPITLILLFDQMAVSLEDLYSFIMEIWSFTGF